jgi:hypothetical protein
MSLVPDFSFFLLNFDIKVKCRKSQKEKRNVGMRYWKRVKWELMRSPMAAAAAAALHHFHKVLQLMGWDFSGSYFVQPSGSSSSINIFQTDFSFFYTSRHHIFPPFFM